DRVRDKLASLYASRSDAVGKRELPDLMTGSIVIAGLRFAYPSSEHPVLDELSFEVPMGSVIGVTGAVGSGKSALASVLTGLYPYQGSISINGVELRDLSPTARRDLVAYAGQDAFLFSTSIAGNIAFGEEDGIDQGAMAQALHLSALTEDLSLFPEGVETRIGERGVRVSGGQRQRMALARTLYTDCPLLILDDPFSAVDIATERRMIQRLRTEMPGRTVFIFSHRLNAFEYADQILVLDHGRLAQRGTHEELASQDGIYQRIYSAQIWLERGHDAC
ncbi:MAG: ABC transporter ATP-binding protein, partial [Bacillota bacterium]